jgi:hypothetical protein
VKFLVLLFAFFLVVGCGSPFEPQLFAPLPEASTELPETGHMRPVPDTGAPTPETGRPDAGAGAEAAPGRPDAGAGAEAARPDAQPDPEAGAPDAGAPDAPTPPMEASCDLSPTVPYVACPGGDDTSYSQPDSFCLYVDPTSESSVVPTPPECRCAGDFTCACLALHYADPCAAMGLKSTCSTSGYELDGGFTQPIWQCY